MSANRVAAGLRRARHFGIGAARLGAQRFEAAAPLVERRARRRELVERVLMRRDAIAIELGERGGRARRLPEAADVGGGEQQPRVSRLPELVHFDEPRLEIRPRRVVFPLQLRQSLGDGRPFGLDLRALGIELPKLLDLDLPFELQLAQVAEQRPFLRGELVGFAVQRLHALARAGGERFGAGAVGLLGADGSRRGRRSTQRRREQGTRSAVCASAGLHSFAFALVTAKL